MTIAQQSSTELRGSEDSGSSQPLSIAERSGILFRKAASLGVVLRSDVIDLLARYPRIGDEELEGRLELIVEEAQRRDVPLTTETVDSALTRIFKGRPKRPPVDPEVVLNEVAEYFGVDQEVLQSKRRGNRETSFARHVLMYLLREESGFSSIKSGDFLGGRHHTTVLSGLENVEVWLKEEQPFRESLGEITRFIRMHSSGSG